MPLERSRPLDSADTRRRIKAARALAGFDSANKLAEALRSEDQGRYPSDRTVRKWESGEEEYVPGPMLREIARVCRLPYEFFTGDLWALAAQPAEHEIAAVTARLAAIAERLGALTPTDQDGAASAAARNGSP